ncbi:3-oxoacyl-ACP reductase family protein [Rhodococcus wratislaviensis]|uniref:3-oxoacyl-[acyl-carrier-protein] reductase MabA n=1 Tax=Rhodococcus wratislaviensis NBRC 100605 TaxID=1219028 RepID=X0Q7Z3_RHOWR|nr:3-oxoacyl-ACP reductase family protein [Rhodococcus wratislaviensis]GAF47562.1 3-oxoacyl-[acyl-carrier-protein] reductase [Rhodococcus wratislaviensis NBRC 100605]
MSTLAPQEVAATTPSTDKLAGRVAFVTGGTRGIGAAIAHSLANQGATVAVGYSRDHRSAERFVSDLDRTCRQHAAAASMHQGNVGSAADCRRTIAEVIDAHGRLDILVNNAGITIDKTIAELTDEDWSNVLAVNLSGAFFLSQAALAHMLERGTGRIVNVSSVVGETGNIGQANYAASKSGLFGLTKTLAKEAAFQLAKSGKRTDDSIGITVNAVTPGLIDTEMTAAIPEKVLARLTGQIPAGRAGKPEEIARVVHFLAADASSYITGQVWSVNGGMDM